MPDKKKIEASIIEIIQKMIKEGESEEKIIKTLKELNVDEKQAKKLLLLGEADTFALLENELSKLVKTGIETQKPELEKTINEKITTSSTQIKQDITKKTITEMQEYEKDLAGEIQQFKEEEKEKINKLFFFSEKVKEKINELGNEIHTAQLDLEEMKVKGVSGSNKNIKILLVLFGIVFGIADLYFLYINFNSVSSIDSIIVMLLIAIISVTMFFVATVI